MLTLKRNGWMHSRPDRLTSNCSNIALLSSHSFTMLPETWINSPWTLSGTMLVAG